MWTLTVEEHATHETPEGFHITLDNDTIKLPPITVTKQEADEVFQSQSTTIKQIKDDIFDYIIIDGG
jgi:hypothetical protein